MVRWRAAAVSAAKKKQWRAGGKFGCGAGRRERRRRSEHAALRSLCGRLPAGIQGADGDEASADRAEGPRRGGCGMVVGSMLRDPRRAAGHAGAAASASTAARHEKHRRLAARNVFSRRHGPRAGRGRGGCALAAHGDECLRRDGDDGLRRDRAGDQKPDEIVQDLTHCCKSIPPACIGSSVRCKLNSRISVMY